MRTKRMPDGRFLGMRWLRIAMASLILVVSATPWGRSAPPLLAQAPAAAMPRPAEKDAAIPLAALAAGTTFCQGPSGDWSSASPNFSVISSCTLTLPTTGTVFLKASASVGLASGGAAYEALFVFGLNGTEVAHPRRWVDVATDTGDGSDTGLALSRMILLPPGIHTLGLLGTLTSGAGPAQAFNPAFSAVVVPTRPGWASCSSPSLNTWSTAATSLETVTSCSLTVATTSTVYLDSNASGALATAGASYEGSFQLAVDGSDLSAPQRRLNISANGGDGTDKSLAISRFVTVGPGAHTFGLRARLRSGNGPLRLYFPAVSALVLPAQPGIARCSAIGADWSTDSSSYSPLAACTLTLPVTSTVSLSADASLALNAGGTNYEALLALGVGNSPLVATRRWINIYADSGDGADLPVSLSYLVTLGPGTHTLQLLGSMAGQDGPARAYSPTINAFVVGRPEYNAYLPLVRK